METVPTSNPFAPTLKHTFRLFLIDLEALPEEAFTKPLGLKVRTISDIVHEVNVVNNAIVKVIQDRYDGPMPDSGWIKAPEGLRTKAAAIDAFRKGSEVALAAVEAIMPEAMGVKVMAQEGEVTREQECRFMNIHMWYHLGQLNFVQTMFGDDAWHWKE